MEYNDNSLKTASLYYQANNYPPAEEICYKILNSDPKNARALHLLGAICYKQNKLNQSREFLLSAVKMNYAEPQYHYTLGKTLTALDDDGSSKHYKKALELAPDFIQAKYALGLHFKAHDNLKKARRCFEDILKKCPDYLPAANQLGNVFQLEDMLDKALVQYRRVLEIKPQTPEAHNNIAGVYKLQGKVDMAVLEYEKALEYNPLLASAHYNLGIIHHEAKKITKAERCFIKAVEYVPEYKDALMALANIMRQTERVEEAMKLYRKVIKIDSQSAEAYHNLGNCFQIRGASSIAVECFDRALKLKPDSAEMMCSKAMALDAKAEHDEASEHYQKALDLDHPREIQVLYYQFMAKMKLGDWRHYDGLLKKILKQTEAYVENEEADYTLPPLIMNIMPMAFDLRKKVVEKHAAIQTASADRQIKNASFKFEPETPAKLHIGYVSPDFKIHAVGCLIQDIFALHDRERFEITAYSLVDTKDPVQEKIEKGCDHYKAVCLKTSEEIAHLIYNDQIHILVDLAGYTTYSKPSIFSFRPAPVQMHYLGYLDTMGNESLEYILTDAMAVPEETGAKYTETPIYMPDSFAVCSEQEISEKKFFRKDHGLSDECFVYCCMNSPHKIEPVVFDSWMAILRQTENSVLWLYDNDNRGLTENLRREAEKRDVSGDRIVFAPRLSGAEYLARYQLADLFLDTFIYNAGATLIGALQAGCPAITLLGNSYLSRMGGSICRAAGLELMVCRTREEYEKKAIELCMDATAYKKMTDQWLARRQDAPLFDTAGFVRNLEKAFLKTWDLYTKNHRLPAIYIK